MGPKTLANSIGLWLFCCFEERANCHAKRFVPSPFARQLLCGRLPFLPPRKQRRHRRRRRRFQSSPGAVNPSHGVLHTLRLLLRPPPSSPPRAPPAAGAPPPTLLPRSSSPQAPPRRRPAPAAPAPHGIGPRRHRLFRRLRCACLARYWALQLSSAQLTF